MSSMIEVLLERELNRVRFARLRQQIAEASEETLTEYEVEFESNLAIAHT